MDWKKILIAIGVPFIALIITLLALGFFSLLFSGAIKLPFEIPNYPINAMGGVFLVFVFAVLFLFGWAGYRLAKAFDLKIIGGIIGSLSIMVAIILIFLVIPTIFFNTHAFGVGEINIVLFVFTPIAIVCGAIGGFIASRKK
ncbi:MAG: hypothetical protein Q7S21_04385 [archaeon]|nr:hypothetical protein [archaeon]